MRISDWSSDVCSSDLLEVYGMTENFGLSHTSRPETMRVGYVGAPWPHVECTLSEIGEVLVKAPWLMQGYYRDPQRRSEEHTSELQSLMRISYAVFCLTKTKTSET